MGVRKKQPFSVVFWNSKISTCLSENYVLGIVLHTLASLTLFATFLAVFLQNRRTDCALYGNVANWILLVLGCFPSLLMFLLTVINFTEEELNEAMRKANQEGRDIIQANWEVQRAHTFLAIGCYLGFLFMSRQRCRFLSTYVANLIGERG